MHISLKTGKNPYLQFVFCPNIINKIWLGNLNLPENNIDSEPKRAPLLLPNL